MQVTISVLWNRNNEALTFSSVVTSDGADDRDILVPGEVVDHPVLFTLDKDQILTLLIASDQDVVVKTNSTSSPADTFDISANCPFLYLTDSGIPNPITADIASLFISNAGETPANVTIRAMLDSTP